MLITGGGSGLGRQLAVRAAAKGATVVVWDICAASAQATADHITQDGGRATAMAVDVTDRAAVRQAAESCGEVDVLINNAGLTRGNRLMGTTDEQIEETFNTNTLALYWVTRAFLGGMISRGHGTVVTVASTAALVGVPGQTAYAASKFAAFGFAESLRAELERDRTGVGSLTICPSHLDTGMFQGARMRFPVLLPTLKSRTVAQKVLRAVERGHAQLVLPPLARAIPVARAMHVRHFDRLMALFGTSRVMDAYATDDWEYDGGPSAQPEA